MRQADSGKLRLGQPLRTDWRCLPGCFLTCQIFAWLPSVSLLRQLTSSCLPLCLPCPAAPLALPAPAADDEQQQAARRQALQSLSLAAPPLAPPKLDGRSSKKTKEAAAAAEVAEAAAAADLAPLREGDSLAVTRIKLDMLRCQRGLPAGALTKGLLAPPAWQQAVREADSVPAIRKLLGEVSLRQLAARSCNAWRCLPDCLGVRLLCSSAEPASPLTPRPAFTHGAAGGSAGA